MARALLEVKSNSEATGNAVVQASGDTLAQCAQRMSLSTARQQIAKNTAPAVFPAAKEDAAKPEDVVVTVTAKETDGTALAVTNGLFRATYDTEKLTLKSVEGSAELTSTVTDGGSVTFGYAGVASIPAGEAVAKLIFTPNASGATEVTITTSQMNDAKVALTETVPVTLPETPVCKHTRTEIRGAKEATCTVDGYTGDTFCLDCGEMLRKGEVISANCPSKGFADLDLNRWYHEYTDYVLRRNLMKGMSDTIFAPNTPLNRAMLVTTLYRLAGEPEVQQDSTFTDVPAGRYFTKAVAWAEGNGIAKGITDTTFCPNNPVTREQAATFLYRYVVEYQNQEPVTEADLSIYTDGKTVSEFAKPAVAWATAVGLFEGFPDGSLQPRGDLTRAQMAKLLTIVDQNF